tara:strand:+ start:1636 stop:1827 length:192 start_codon:yes stop_codon:yes gene_type:complete
MVRDDLLVIRADDRQKRNGCRDRATSQEVLARLSKMLQKCEIVSGYGYQVVEASQCNEQENHF